MLKIKEAIDELAEKSYMDIQKETTWKWGSRAAASYELLLKAKTKHEKLMYSYLAEEYYHEAIEHAALVEDNGALVEEFQQEISDLKEKASKHVIEELTGE